MKGRLRQLFGLEPPEGYMSCNEVMASLWGKVGKLESRIQTLETLIEGMVEATAITMYAAGPFKPRSPSGQVLIWRELDSVQRERYRQMARTDLFEDVE